MLLYRAYQRITIIHDTELVILKFHKTVALLSLVYGSELWMTAKRMESRIQGQEMKFLGRVKVRRVVVGMEYKTKIFRKNYKFVTLYNRTEANGMNAERDYRSKLIRYKPSGRRTIGSPRKR